MRDLNTITLTGRLGRDPEVRYTQKGSAVTTLSLAVQYDDRTSWIKAMVFGKTAEIIGQYAKKGSRIGVSGRIQEDKWTDKDGQKRSVLVVITSQVVFLDKKEDKKESNDVPF